MQEVIHEIWGVKYTINSNGEVWLDGIMLKGNKGEFYERLDDCRQWPEKFNVKRIVADNFVPNPNNYRYVMCIDQGSCSVAADNLYWSRNNRKKKTVGGKTVYRHGKDPEF